jgi:SAM-dependent methyltransferase
MFATSSYWDRFFASDAPFDCFFDWSAVEAVFLRHFRDAALVVHVGNGQSLVPVHAARATAHQLQLVTDVSEVATRHLAARFQSNARLAFVCCDATRLPFASGSIAAVFDKGTLDALIYDAALADAYVRELVRVLQVGGVALVFACCVAEGDGGGSDAFLRRQAADLDVECDKFDDLRWLLTVTRKSPD